MGVSVQSWMQALAQGWYARSRGRPHAGRRQEADAAIASSQIVAHIQAHFSVACRIAHGRRGQEGDEFAITCDTPWLPHTREEFEENQRMIAENAHMKKRMTRRSARGGRALLTGLATALALPLHVAGAAILIIF